MTQNYDPSKRYTWTPEDTFEMSGEQFGIVLNAIRGILSTPEAARILMLDKANTAIESMMANAILVVQLIILDLKITRYTTLVVGGHTHKDQTQQDMQFV